MITACRTAVDGSCSECGKYDADGYVLAFKIGIHQSRLCAEHLQDLLSQCLRLGEVRAAGSVTDSQLRDLFAAHCECRPLDLWRTESEHSHDCDTAILRDVQLALGIVTASSYEKNRAARARCAEQIGIDERRK